MLILLKIYNKKLVINIDGKAVSYPIQLVGNKDGPSLNVQLSALGLVWIIVSVQLTALALV